LIEKTQNFCGTSYDRAFSKTRDSRPAFGPELGAYLAIAAEKRRQAAALRSNILAR
jgi:hypothetical protein